MQEMLAEQKRATEAILALVETLKQQPREVVVREVVPMETGNYHELPPVLEVSERKAASPKLQLAVKWLLEHPEDKELSDRKLAEKLGLSHPWIGKARKLIEAGSYQEVL